MKAIGVDAAFANMGFARVDIVYSGQGQCDIKCIDLTLVSTEVTEDRKVVRKSSTELRRARELHDALQMYARGAVVCFAEVPSGSQSANAARALGIAVGVLASCPIPVIEVSQQEVKEAVTGRKKGTQPSKAEVIAWAIKRWPRAPWLLHEHSSAGRRADKGPNKGKIVGAYKKGDPLTSNEHLADALATIAAGVATPEFKRLIALTELAAPPQARTPRVRIL